MIKSLVAYIGSVDWHKVKHAANKRMGGSRVIGVNLGGRNQLAQNPFV